VGSAFITWQCYACRVADGGVGEVNIDNRRGKGLSTSDERGENEPYGLSTGTVCDATMKAAHARLTNLRMKIFLDSANLEEIQKAVSLGIIDGVTTNPALIAKEGVPLAEQIRNICQALDGDVSASVVATAAPEMIEEGRRLAAIHENVVVKVPLTRDGIIATGALTRVGVRVNVTLCFSAAQALLAAKAGAWFVSPFVGRLDDIGTPGINLINDIVKIYANYDFKTQVLAASLRGPQHVIDVAKGGAHVVTVAPKVLDQLFFHPLTERGLDQFLAKYNRAFELANMR
jgi:transaldolase